MANRNRTAGHNYERKIVREMAGMVESGDIVTSRAESRNMDNLGADIIDASNPNQRSLPLIIFHNKVKKGNKNFTSIGEYVIMEKEVYYSLIYGSTKMPHNIQCKLYMNNPNYHEIISFYNNNK